MKNNIHFVLYSEQWYKWFRRKYCLDYINIILAANGGSSFKFKGEITWKVISVSLSLPQGISIVTFAV